MTPCFLLIVVLRDNGLVEGRFILFLLENIALLLVARFVHRRSGLITNKMPIYKISVAADTTAKRAPTAIVVLLTTKAPFAPLPAKPGPGAVTPPPKGPVVPLEQIASLEADNWSAREEISVELHTVISTHPCVQVVLWAEARGQKQAFSVGVMTSGSSIALRAVILQVGDIFREAAERQWLHIVLGMLNSFRGVAEVLALMGVGVVARARIKTEATVAVVVVEERIFEGRRVERRIKGCWKKKKEKTKNGRDAFFCIAALIFVSANFNAERRRKRRKMGSWK